MTSPHDVVTEATALTEAVMAPQQVPINVYEAGDHLLVVAPMVAVTPEDVQVELHPDEPAVLRFWAHVRSAGVREYLVHEWEYGGYERNVELPSGYGASVDASLKNGQLVIRLAAGEPVAISIRPTTLA